MVADGGPSGAPWWRPRHPPLLPASRTAWSLTAAGIVLFSGAGLLVASGPPGWDAELYRDVNEVPDALAAVLTPLSRAFLAGGITVTVLVAFAYVLVRNRSAFPVLIATAAAGVAWLSANLAKAVADRPRPYEVIGHAVLRQQPAHGTSFPSSHTAVALATAIALVPFVARPVAVVGIAYALLVGWSRIYVGVHYPLDVLGGAGIGIAIGGVALLAAGRTLRRANGDASRASGTGRPDP